MTPRLLLFIALVISPLQARAQDASFFTGIFKSFHSVTIYTQASQLQGSSGLQGGGSRCIVLDMCGGGIELLIDLDTITKRGVELGVGASYLRGVEFQDSTLDLHASLRSFPTLSGYATIFSSQGTSVYLGLSFGLIEIWNGQVYSPAGKEITLKGQTFEYGGMIGLHRDVKQFGGPFLEAGYRRRHFTSLDWGIDSLPDNHRRSLDFSGWNVALGWQFKLRQDVPKKQPPAYAGRWRLVQIHGDSLPFAVSQVLDPHNAAQTRRTQWLDGSIVFTPEGKHYELTVNTRVETLNAADVVGIGAVETLRSTGVYTESESLITLQPSAETGLTQQAGALAPRPRVLTRVGNDLVMELEGHFLTFTKS